MCEAGDETIEADDVRITTQVVYVNGAWTPRAVMLNTIFTGVGALTAVAALVFSCIALWG